MLLGGREVGRVNTNAPCKANSRDHLRNKEMLDKENIRLTHVLKGWGRRAEQSL